MRTYKTKNNKNKIIHVFLLILLTCIGAYFITASYNRLWPFIENSASTNAEVKTDDTTDTTKNDGEPSAATPPKAVTPSNNVPQELQLIISALNQTSEQLQVRALIQAVISEGSCTLTMTQGTKTVERKSQVQASATTSTCQGFNVALSDLQTGEWDILLTVESGDSAGSVNTKVIIE